MKIYVLVRAVSAALTYFFDPQNGKRRRHVARDRAVSFARRTSRRAVRTVRSETYAVAMKARHLREEEKPPPNDATLARKVESEVFRDASIPKGQIDVNAENGVVFLRGEVDSLELISSLEKTTRKVQGVRDVENLLHLKPGAESTAA
jgi:osmotically-inducible protein OsmY